METKCRCHCCGAEVNANARRCPCCYVALGAASRAPSPLRAAPSAVPGAGRLAPGPGRSGPSAPFLATAAALAVAVAVPPPPSAGVACPACETTVVPVARRRPHGVEPLPARGSSSYPAASPVPPGWDLEDFEVFGPAMAEAPSAQIIPGPWPARSHRVTHASWRQRAIASLLDGTVFVPGLLASAWKPGLGIILLAVATLFSAWQVCWLQGRTGQTMGKHQVGVFVVDGASLAPIGTRRAALRQLAHGIDAVALGVGYLWPLWDSRRQTFADQLLGTVVASADN